VFFSEHRAQCHPFRAWDLMSWKLSTVPGEYPPQFLVFLHDLVYTFNSLQDGLTDQWAGLICDL